jgi:uncharacterized protein (TIGR03435 family)
MKSILMLATLLALSFDRGHCQEIAKTPAFEVASITPCKPGTPQPPGQGDAMVRMVFPGGRFQVQAADLKFLMEWAYNIIPEQHSGGPSWMDDQRYDIVAKTEGDRTDAEMKLMLRALLAERFKLKFHTEKREMSIVAVSLGKGEPKLFPPKDGETHSLRVIPNMDPDHKRGSYRIVATRFAIDQLNDQFARALGRVIVNQTGLEGDFDFTLDFSFDEERPNPLDPSNIINALRDQLGLTVKSQKGLADFYVIDSAEKVQAGN